jgi:hypothetical protein
MCCVLVRWHCDRAGDIEANSAASYHIHPFKRLAHASPTVTRSTRMLDTSVKSSGIESNQGQSERRVTTVLILLTH